ncbi:hypothetical protein GEV33_011508 [Tenebrio molitor]|uniref:Anaphase-promoting complex subunit 13 n=1 Tax=Tenebrio molitor TaxID=7067 RepID=A0A8J6LFU3_TENMO|nr:hypothetical protein GEV33_011508 [Tenebrio molitor]
MKEIFMHRRPPHYLKNEKKKEPDYKFHVFRIVNNACDQKKKQELQKLLADLEISEEIILESAEQRKCLKRKMFNSMLRLFYENKENDKSDLLFYASAQFDLIKIRTILKELETNTDSFVQDITQTRCSDSVIVFALKYGDITKNDFYNCIKELTEAGIDINRLDFKGKSAIDLIALFYKQYKNNATMSMILKNVATLFLEKGLYAIDNKDTAIVLKNDMKLVLPNDGFVSGDGKTHLFRCIMKNDTKSFLNFQELQKYVNVDDSENTLLQFASKRSDNMLPVVQHLLKNGADPNKVTPRNKLTPLELAAKNNNQKIFEELLKHVDTKITQENFNNFVRWRLKPMKGKLFKSLLESDKIEPQFTYDRSGNTALHYAVSFSHKEAIQKLLKRNSSLIVKNKLNKCVLDMIDPEDLEKHFDSCLVLDNYAPYFSDINYKMRFRFNCLVDSQEFRERMDSTVAIEGYFVDLIDDKWRSDKLPEDDINVPTYELADPEADSGDIHLTLKEQEQKWTDIALSALSVIPGLPVPEVYFVPYILPKNVLTGLFAILPSFIEMLFQQFSQRFLLTYKSNIPEFSEEPVPSTSTDIKETEQPVEDVALTSLSIRQLLSKTTSFSPDRKHRAYNFVRESFNTCLPHPKTLSRWYKTVNGNPGFTEESFHAIRQMVEKSNYELFGALLVDEVAIRKHLDYDGHNMTGYVDLGTGLEGDDRPLAKEALVFMVVSINSSWKIPVGYFLVDGVNSEQRCNLLKQCLSHICETGLRILTLTFDGLSREKGIIFDDNNDPILWDYIKKLHELQDAEGLHLANKVKALHVNFYKQKMKTSTLWTSASQQSQPRGHQRFPRESKDSGGEAELFTNPPPPLVSSLSEMKDSYRMNYIDPKMPEIEAPAEAAKCHVVKLGCEQQPAVPPQRKGFWRWTDPYLTVYKSDYIPHDEATDVTGRPKTVTTPEIVDKIHDVTLADRRIKVHEIAEAVRMSYERDFIFCTMNLIKNLSVKLMPRFLSPEQKRVPAQTPAECL